MKRLSDTENLAELERLIELYRSARSAVDTPEHRSYLALRAAAGDLRARLRVKISDALRELQEEMDATAATRGRDGVFDYRRTQRLAEALSGRWPIVRQALERFGEG